MVLRLRRRQGNWQRLQGKPSRERHIFSLIFNVTTVVAICISLGMPWWSDGKTQDGSCYFEFGLAKVSVHQGAETSDYPLSTFYNPTEQVVIACILCLLTCTLVLQFLAAVVSAGYPREKFEFIRHFSVFNVVSLICIVGACGFWLWVSELIESSQEQNKDGILCSGVQVAVSFHAGFYVCIGSGVLCLIALSGNMICARTAVERRRQARQRLRLRERNFAQLLSRNSVEMTQMREHPRNQSTVESGLRVLNQSSSQSNVPLSGPANSMDTVPPPLTTHSSGSGLVPPPDVDFPPPDVDFPPPDMDFPPPDEDFPPPDEDFPPPADIGNPSTDGPVPPTDEENPPPYVP